MDGARRRRSLSLLLLLERACYLFRSTRTTGHMKTYQTQMVSQHVACLHISIARRADMLCYAIEAPTS